MKFDREDQGREIKARLVLLDRTQRWLVDQLKERGILTDETEVSAVLSGRRTGPKADAIMRESHEIVSIF